MSEQSTTISRTDEQNKILELEKKYMDILESIITSQVFIDDLKIIEVKTREDYIYLQEVWKKKNKIKEASERLVKYHLYKSFGECAKFYPSPVSADIALILDDVILNVDIKTVDVNGNNTDVKNIQFEHNQCSFENNDVDGLPVKAHLRAKDKESNKPMLTYLVKIIYFDNGKSFNLINQKEKPSLILTCIPNGLLSNLFENNLFKGFKDYKYFNEKDDKYYTPKEIIKYSIFQNLAEEEKYNKIIEIANIPSDWEKTKTEAGKIAFFDKIKKQLWVTVKRGKSNSKIFMEAVKCGNTIRFNCEWLEKRYDSKNNSWNGVRNYYKIY